MWWVLTCCFSPPGHANASFCPHGYGCRTLVVCEGRAILDVTDSELTVTVRVPEGRWLWLVSWRLVSVLHHPTIRGYPARACPLLSTGDSEPGARAAASGDLQAHLERPWGSMSQDDTHQLLGALLVRVAFLEEEAWKETGESGRKGWGHPELSCLFTTCS